MENEKNDCPLAGRMGQCVDGKCFHGAQGFVIGETTKALFGVSSGGGFEYDKCVNCDQPLGTDGKCEQCDVPV